MLATEQQINDLAGGLWDDMLERIAQLHDDDRPDVAYAVRKGIGG